MCAALANVEEDSWEWHAFDTVKGGDYLVDQPAAEIMCREAVDAVIELEHFGLPFNRTEKGLIDQRRFGGHTRNHGEAPVRRACFAADRTGHMILQTLYQQCVARGVDFFNEFQVLDVAFVGDDPARGVAGVVAYEQATGDLHVFSCRAALFATGGFGRMFKVSSNAHTLTGDGPGLLFRRGVPLQDMEFFQFHPTGIYKLGILLSEAARGEGGILRNAEGERFMERYAPTVKDLAPRDMVSRAMLTEIRAGPGRRAGQGLPPPRPHPPPARADRREAARHHRVRPHLPGHRAQDRPHPHPAHRPLRHGRHPHQRRRPRWCSTPTAPSPPASTPPASAPACRSTAPTGWAPTPCSTSSCSDGGAGRPWPSSCTAAGAASPRPPEGAEDVTVGRHRAAQVVRRAPRTWPTSAPSCRRR